MIADQAGVAENDTSEAQRLLRELDHMMDYWEHQACVAKTEKAVSLFLKRKQQCRKMADQVIRKMERR